MDKKRKVEIEDLYRFRLVSDPRVSPDGSMVAFVQTRLRKKKNDYASNIWLMPTDGSEEAFKLTASDKRDTSPRWSPDGKELAFISTRSGKPQVWVIRVRGGEARQLTRVKRGVGEFEWSPDGRWIVFSAQIDNEQDKQATEEGKDEKHGDSSDTEGGEPASASEEGFTATMRPPGEWEEDEEEDEEEEEKDNRAKVITRLQYKADGEGFIERRAHLFIVPSKGGKPVQLTDSQQWDARSPRWSPDGKRLAFVANQEPDAEYHNIQDIFVMPIDEEGKPGETRRVTGHDRAIADYDWLPSGDGFALASHTRINEAAYSTNVGIWTQPVDGGEASNLTEGLDRTVGLWLNSDLRSGAGDIRPRFSKGGVLIYFPVMNGGAVQVYSVPAQGGEVKQVIGGERQVLGFDVAQDSIVFAATTATHPNDLFRAELDGGNERQLTEVNQDVLAELALTEPREFWIDRPDGERVQGWMLMPHGYQEGEKYPFILQIHGGPHTSYGGAYFHEFQTLAARGYVVMYTNPRGSQGYGQAFSDAIINDWGGVDYEDLMACVDYAISQRFIDEARMGVAGGSYGGYMVTWIIGHTQRFKAAVASRMVSNVYSAWGTGDFTWMLWNWEFEGTPQERTALYLERSPITHVANIETPLLITHALDDMRTDFEQADQMYTALKVLRKEVKMVTFPFGGHDISRSGKPSLRVERLRHIADWFDQHLK